MTTTLILFAVFAISLGAAEVLRQYRERKWKREFVEPWLRASIAELREITDGINRETDRLRRNKP